jgi:lysophospholipase L1-like esterase
MPDRRAPRRSLVHAIRRLSPRTRLLGAAAVIAAALPLLFTAAPASAAVNYVALGDSYSSGLGAGSYGSSGSCYRSANAYSQVWANANAPSTFAFVACSGATTSDVISSQLSAVTSSTTLISITIGGNDVGFASVMETCVLGTDSDCINAVNQAESEAQTTLPGALDTLFSDIKARAPGAHVVVLGYPEFYDLSKSSTCIGLSTKKRTALNGGADVLDNVIQAATGRAGFTWVDVRSAFTGHEICDSGSYLHSVDWSFLQDSYHPTASGQANGYEPAFASGA